jgi:hypothetical protein
VGPHPIRIVITDDLRRSRLTVFFRLLLAIPHYVWLALWSVAAALAVLVSWFATLVMGRSPAALHRFLAAYLRYTTHLGSYLYLAGNPFPGFTGAPGSYPVDLEIDAPEAQNRLVTLFRIVLVIPALLVQTALLGGYFSVAAAIAFLAWFASLALGRISSGFRDALVYALRYSAQVAAYMLLLTDRYPHSDPTLPADAGERPPRPIRLGSDDDLRRSRLTVFFRLLLAIPHLIWLALWSVVVLYLLSWIAWLVTLIMGRLPEPLHRFIATYLRYDIHVNAYVLLVANPFPGFVGREGTYPVDLAIDGPQPQHRLVTFFRLLLGLPALLVASCLGFALYVVAFLGWFAALVTGRMPNGLAGLGRWALGYTAQMYGYLLFLTDRYPHSGPPVEAPAATEEPDPGLEPVAAPA